ncbi:hypothetical protein, partial [[Mycobacterium] nativiensis]
KHQPKTDIKKTPHPQHGAPRMWQKQQQTKTTKHTIEFSNNTPGFRQPRYSTPETKLSQLRVFSGLPEGLPDCSSHRCGAPA